MLTASYAFRFFSVHLKRLSASSEYAFAASLRKFLKRDSKNVHPCTSMPSKGKKNSKTLSRLSNSNHSQSPVSRLAIPPASEVCEDDFLSSIEEASSKYPSLIGKSAFVGRVTNASVQSTGCKVWVSESSMVSSSFTQGAIVSVISFSLLSVTMELIFFL